MRTNQKSISFLVNTITHLNGTNLRVQVIGPRRSRPKSRLKLLLLFSIHTVNIPQHTEIISHYPKIRIVKWKNEYVSTLDFHRKEVIVPPKVLSVTQEDTHKHTHARALLSFRGLS